MMLPPTGGMIVNSDRDRDLIGLAARANYRRAGSSRYFAQLAFDRSRYETRTDQLGFRRDSEGLRLAAGVESEFGDGNEVEAYFGALQQDYADERFGVVRKPDFGVQLKLRPTMSSKATVKLLRSLNETTEPDSPGYLKTSLSASWEAGTSARFSPFANLAYSLSDYLQTRRDDRAFRSGQVQNSTSHATPTSLQACDSSNVIRKTLAPRTHPMIT